MKRGTMDNIKEITTRKSFAIIAALIGGLALGLLFAWVIAPVQFVDADIYQLREDLRVDHLRMTIDSYGVNSDAELALQRYDALGEYKEETIDAVAEDPGEVSPSDLQKFQALVAVESSADTPVEGAEADVDEGSASTEPSTASRYILPVCLGTLALGAMLGVALVLRRRMEVRDDGYGPEYTSDAQESVQAIDSEPDEVETPSDASLATFQTTYTIGDDLYDDSFSVESPASGDFLGECGVGIAEAIGQGDPKKVSAFEVWLFDKNDIQTVTKIIMSKYTYSDEETRAKLAAKGDPVVSEGGEVVELETASLRVEARIVDMSYGEGALPRDSFFDRMTIELKAFAKT